MKVLWAHNRYKQAGGEDRYVTDFSKIQKASPRFDFRILMESNQSRLKYSKRMKELLFDFRPEIVHFHNVFFVLGLNAVSTVKDILPQSRIVMTLHNHRFFCTNGIAYRNEQDCTLCKNHFGIRPLIHNCNSDLLKSAAYWSSLQIHRYRQTLEKVDHFIAPSQYILSAYRSSFLGNRPMSVIPHFAIAQASQQFSIHLRKGYLFIGRPSEEKGIDDFISAAKLFPSIPFSIAGSVTKSLISKMRGIPNLTALGFLDPADLLHKISQCRAVIVPSRVHESFGLSALESLQQGTLVLASRAGALTELPIPKECFFDRRDVNGIQNAIQWTEKLSPENYLELSQSVQKQISERYSPVTHLSSLEALYQSLLS